MNKDTLQRLEKLNQLKLDDAQRERTLGFFKDREAELVELEKTDTADVERMVHVMPLHTVVREDAAKKLFTRDQLQQSAPETLDGYWQVHRLVE